MLHVFILGHGECSDFPLDIPLGLGGEVHEVGGVNVTDENKIYDAGILALGVIVDQESLSEISQPFDNRFENLIHTQCFCHH